MTLLSEDKHLLWHKALEEEEAVCLLWEEKDSDAELH